MTSSAREMNKRCILEFLRKNVLATISTVNPQNLQPESALVAFCELGTLEIIITTLKGSRKYENLLKNDKVALVMGWEEDPKHWATLQYEGKAVEVCVHKESSYRKLFLQKEGSPCTQKFLNRNDMKVFKITPTWIGYSRFPQNKKPIVIEIEFF